MWRGGDDHSHSSMLPRGRICDRGREIAARRHVDLRLGSAGGAKPSLVDMRTRAHVQWTRGEPLTRGSRGQADKFATSAARRLRGQIRSGPRNRGPLRNVLSGYGCCPGGAWPAGLVAGFWVRPDPEHTGCCPGGVFPPPLVQLAGVIVPMAEPDGTTARIAAAPSAAAAILARRSVDPSSPLLAIPLGIANACHPWLRYERDLPSRRSQG
jgi:hypothetical protein